MRRRPVRLVTVRLSDEEIERWKEEAWRRKLSLSAFIRTVVRAALSSDLSGPDEDRQP
jgi:Ribbon-helix-helix protein, copG family.